MGGSSDSGFRAADFDGWRAKLFNGEIVNTTENRAAKHWSLRITDPPGGDNEVTAVLDRMHAFAHEIAESGNFDAVIHLGIGGSDLGPRVVLDALKAYRRPKITVRSRRMWMARTSATPSRVSIQSARF